MTEKEQSNALGSLRPIRAETNLFDQAVGVSVNNWQAAGFPAATELCTDNVKLRLANGAQHAKALYEEFAHSGDRLWTYMPYGPFPSADDYFQWMQTISQREDARFYCICDSNGEYKGIFALDAIKQRKGSIELAHVMFSSRLQQSRLASEAVFLVLKYVFSLGYRRCEWKCNALNTPSKRAALRFGFSYEGLFRNHMVVKQRNRDTSWFAMTHQDWQQLKPCYETWLSTENFDQSGKQKQALSALTRFIHRKLESDPFGTFN